jgi:hypothetical protein
MPGLQAGAGGVEAGNVPPNGGEAARGLLAAPGRDASVTGIDEDLEASYNEVRCARGGVCLSAFASKSTHSSGVLAAGIS